MQIDPIKEPRERRDGLGGEAGVNGFQKYDQHSEEMFERYGINDKEWRHAAYAFAYEKGHAFGFGEVEIEFGDVMELLRVVGVYDGRL